jgi:hypothetical protein
MLEWLVPQVGHWVLPLLCAPLTQVGHWVLPLLWAPLAKVGHWRPAIPLGTSGSLAALLLYAVEQELM